MSEPGVILSVKDIDISFGGVHAVNHVSFDIHKGEILGLIGPNGSGKSTCVNIISGYYRPDSGKVFLEGKDITSLPMHKRAFLGLGRTFQTPQPFDRMTVLESIYTVSLLHTGTMKQAQDLTDRILDFTGLEKDAETRCAQLSVERRKWLDMARVLAIDPKVIMLDECLAGLNPSEMESSIELVRKINRTGVTILFIEHVMAAVVKLCHRVIVLNDGRFLAEGRPETVMQMEEVVSAYLGGGTADAT